MYIDSSKKCTCTSDAVAISVETSATIGTIDDEFEFYIYALGKIQVGLPLQVGDIERQLAATEILLIYDFQTSLLIDY